MAQKWNLQDIVPPDRSGSQKRRPVQSRGSQRPAERREADPSASPDESEPLTRIEIVDGRLSRMRRAIFIAVAFAIIIFIGLSITILLSGAEITVFPKNRSTTISATFTAKQQPGVGDLSYELLTIEEEGEERVTASGEEEVSERASGIIKIFNEFSSNPQRLIKNTRFESPDGLVYRISDSIVVPGYIKDAEGLIIPGSITAEVFADGPGESYNITETRFTVPGLKGSEQYEKIYAETTVDGITGGFEGMKFIIDENELATKRQELQTELRDTLLSKIQDERPTGFVLYEDSITFTFESLPATEAGGKAAVLHERARLHVPLFNASSFAEHLAQNAVAGYEDEPVRLEDPYTLTFSYPESITGEDVVSQNEMTFNLNGNVKIIWVYDEEMLKNDLLGISKNAIPTVLSGYPAIERAEAVVRPFWKQAFPEDEAEISITEVLE